MEEVRAGNKNTLDIKSVCSSFVEVTGTSEVDGKVYVYFEKMTNVEVCTPFNIVEKVANGTYKGSVKIYDYYNHDLETTEVSILFIAAQGYLERIHNYFYFRCSMLLLVSKPIQLKKK